MSSTFRNERRKKKFESMKQLPKKEENVKWSKKSILFIAVSGVTLLYLVAISTFNFQPSSFFNSKDKTNYRTTSATVYYYETKSMMLQSRIGSSNQIVGYLVRYRFKVNDYIYDREESLSLYTKADFLIYIANNLHTNSFLVRYNITNPKEAYLIQRKVE